MAKTPEMKGNKLSFLYSLSRFLPNFLQSSDAATTYLKKSDASTTYLSKTDASTTYLAKADATIIIKYSADGGTTILNEDAVGVTHIGIARKAGLTTAEQAVSTNYTWIAKNVIES